MGTDIEIKSVERQRNKLVIEIEDLMEQKLDLLHEIDKLKADYDITTDYLDLLVKQQERETIE